MHGAGVLRGPAWLVPPGTRGSLNMGLPITSIEMLSVLPATPGALCSLIGSLVSLWLLQRVYRPSLSLCARPVEQPVYSMAGAFRASYPRAG